MLTPELFIAFLITLCIIALFAQRAHISYPVAFLLGGIALGVIPHTPKILIPPQYIMVIFLPPLLMEAAYFTSIRDFTRNLRSILQLSIGLVVVTSIAVAYLFSRMAPNGGWIEGLVLGAIVAPPDAVAATSIIKNLRVPKRIVTILEGESLLNDATGLVLYRLAVGAVAVGSFSFAAAGASFVWMVVCGIVVGVALGQIFVWVYPHIKEPSVEVLSTFIVPYSAYVLAELLDGSGVLAVVTAGLLVGWYAPSLFKAQSRMPIETVWKMVTFILNAVVFLLIGLSVPGVLKDLAGYSPQTLMLYAAMLCGVILAVRIAYVYAMAYGVRFMFPALRKRDPYPSVQNVFVIAWTGMRGVVSLATALALPLTLADGADFPNRSLIIFLALSVIIFTLVFQGITLPFILRFLPLSYNPEIIWEDWQARVAAAKQALEHIDHLSLDDPDHHAARERIKKYYEDRLKTLGDGPNTPLFPTEEPTSQNHPVVQAERKIWRQAVEAERSAVITLRGQFKIGDDIMNDILRELDLSHSRFS